MFDVHFFSVPLGQKQLSAYALYHTTPLPLPNVNLSRASRIFPKGKQQRKVKARSLFCFWAVRELGMSLRELARRSEISSPGVGFSVERGETIARENGLQLIE